MNNILLLGDALEELKKLPSNSIDSMVTDPPAGISFMKKDWDSDKGGKYLWIQWLTEVMKEAFRVLKPGSHALVWALPRTSHWTALALEDAGFEIRDCLYHIFGAGFPKSQDIGKAIDKLYGAEREIIGISPNARPAHKKGGKAFDKAVGKNEHSVIYLTRPATQEATYWDGWGTGLRPNIECWWLIRKPIEEESIVKQVLSTGTGAINIKGVQTEERWPSHVLLGHTPLCTEDNCVEHCPCAILQHQTGKDVAKFYPQFYYTPKASQKDKTDDGVVENDHPTVKSTILMEWLVKLITPTNGTVLDPFCGSGSTLVACNRIGFSFVGVEKDDHYMKITKDRLGIE